MGGGENTSALRRAGWLRTAGACPGLETMPPDVQGGQRKGGGSPQLHCTAWDARCEWNRKKELIAKERTSKKKKKKQIR